ncbi:MAG: hypothetical protein AAGA85_22410, partial [Bacteroidota bacterium]
VAPDAQALVLQWQEIDHAMALILRASSLIEVVVSMTIASIVFSLGLMIYLNVVSSLDQEYREYLYDVTHFHLDSLSSTSDPLQDRSFLASSGLQVMYTTQAYLTFEDAYQVTCSVIDSIDNEVVREKIIYFYVDEGEDEQD